MSLRSRARRVGLHVIGVALGLLSICTPGEALEKRIFVLQSPVLPLRDALGNVPAIVYTASIEDATAVTQFEVFEHQYKVVQCPTSSNQYNQPPCLQDLQPPVERSVGTCRPGPTACTVNSPGGYTTDVGYVTYWAVATTSSGVQITGNRIGYALGGNPWNNPQDPNYNNFSVSPIPIYITHDTNDPNVDERKAKIDVVFIPDADYGLPIPKSQFVTDVTNILQQGYFSSLGFAVQTRQWRGDYNFYLTFENGQVFDACQTYTAPQDWTTMKLTADAGLIVYHRQFTPCTMSPGASGTLFSTSLARLALYGYAETVHETGHAVYRLSDEYAGGWYEWLDPSSVLPHPNVFPDRRTCVSTQCNTYTCNRYDNSRNLWRCDGNTDLMAAQTNNGSAFDKCDVSRIQWKHVDKCEAGSCY